MDTTLTVYIFIEISGKKKEEFQEEFYRRIKIRECRRRENLFCLIGIILVFPPLSLHTLEFSLRVRDITLIYVTKSNGEL